jgi:LmbE family N-acetylglucosaminyl deacetylase
MGVAFYVSPHQDDWQLFCGDRAWADIAAGHEVVIVYPMAGDAGGTKVPGWWQARELAALESCRLVTGPKPHLWGVRWLHGRPITYCDCGLTTSYFLRLPDGRLEAFRQGNPAALAALDGSTAYGSWGDFCDTLRALLERHRPAGSELGRVHAPDFDAAFNPHGEGLAYPQSTDHPDHIATAQAVRAATDGGGYRRFWWVGYDTSRRLANLDRLDTDRKRRLQRAYTDRLLVVTREAGTPVDDWAEAGRFYKNWFGKTYLRADGETPAAPQYERRPGLVTRAMYRLGLKR